MPDFVFVSAGAVVMAGCGTAVMLLCEDGEGSLSIVGAVAMYIGYAALIMALVYGAVSCACR